MSVDEYDIMGFRHTVRAFRCDDIEFFRNAVAHAAEKQHARFSSQRKPKDPGNQLLVAKSQTAISVHYPYLDGDFFFFREVSVALEGIPWIEVRIQEGSHWDYSIYRGYLHLDQFSTFPQYWEGEEDPIQLLYTQGRPAMLSLIFGVPVERFERYLRHWYSDYGEVTEDFKSRLEGKAYPEDRSPYCDYEQFWDFLRSLSIFDPCAIPESERFVWDLRLRKRNLTPKKGWRRYLPWIQ